MEITLAYVIAPLFLTVGLSILLHAKAWQNLMDKYEKDHLLLFPLMFIYIILGMIVIKLYNVWAWNIWLIVTLVGWIMLAKGVLYFLLPGSVLKSVLKIKKNLVLLYVCGAIAVIIGLALGYFGVIVSTISTSVL